MRIAIISDTHDHIWNLQKAMPTLVKTDVVLHCGDLCSPFVVKQLGDGLGEIPVHVVWGNNDGDKRALDAMARKAGNIQIHGDFASLEFEGVKIAMNHYPEIGQALAGSNEFDLVCYGHDHIAYEEKIGESYLLNPGEIMGLNGKSTFAIFSTVNKTIEWVEIS